MTLPLPTTESNGFGRHTNGAGDTSTIRVFIVAKIRSYREALAQVLGREPGIAVAGTGGDDGRLDQAVAEDRVDVALVDADAIQSLGAVSSDSSSAANVSVIALGVTEDEDEVIACAEAGVSGFFDRDGSIGELVLTIASVAQGERPFPPQVTATLVKHLAELAADRVAAGEQLTPRELEIAGLIDEGLSNKQIARRLQIELATVKNHVHNILEKLNVHSRLEAVARLREAGLGATKNGAPETNGTSRI
jgi:two-component system nitrate/nitrite response regulator NarL